MKEKQKEKEKLKQSTKVENYSVLIALQKHCR